MNSRKIQNSRISYEKLDTIYLVIKTSLVIGGFQEVYKPPYDITSYKLIGTNKETIVTMSFK
jgi:hypothetical protein